MADITLESRINDHVIMAYDALGSSIKAQTLGLSANRMTTSVAALSNQDLVFGVIF